VSPRRQKLPVRPRRDPVGPWGRYVNDVLVRKGLSYRRAYEPINDAAHAQGDRYVNYGRHSIRNWIGGVIPHADALRWIAAGWNEPIERVSAEAEAHRRWRYEQQVQAPAGEARAAASPLPATPEPIRSSTEPARSREDTLWRPTRMGVDGDLTPDDEERILLAMRRPMRVDAKVVDALTRILAAQRRTEDVIGSAHLIAPVTGQLATIERLIVEVRGPTRSAVVDMAGQWAEYAGWLHTSTGQVGEARRWFDRAHELATEVGNTSLAAEALSFKGHLAFLLGQVGPMLGLTRAAQRDPSVWVGQRAYDAHQEARVSAALGDREAAARKLDEGADLAAHALERSDETPPWKYYYTSSFYALELGLSYRYLGRQDDAYNDEAIAALTSALEDLGENRSSEWVGEYVYHLAVAYMQAGAPDQACETLMDLIAIAGAAESARLSERVRGLYGRLLRRWPDDPHVIELGEALHS
jgi:tetratricopeptide (TPR) repeat protein